MSVRNLEMEDRVMGLSKKGIYPKQIAKILNISYGWALILVKRGGGQLKGSGGCNKIVEKNPFIDSPESNYWLGYLAADGNLSKSRYTISIQLKDLNMIMKYRDFVNPKLSIYYKVNKAGSKMGAVVYENKEIWEYLYNLGITPAKSRTLKYNGEFNWDFIRGVFDGDGSISNQEPKITTGSENFKNQLEEFFLKEGLEYKTHIKGNQIFDVYIRGNSRFTFFDKMYYDVDCVKLDRKYEKYRAALKKFKVKNIG